MKNAIIKVNDDTQTIAEHDVALTSRQPVIIQARDNVNYELFDMAIGRAPNHIITQRVNDDLHIGLQAQRDDEGNHSDVIIKDFYDYEYSALIGVSEDNRFYYYVPDTGEIGNYVTELTSGGIDGQALGGRPQSDAWWASEAISTIQADSGIDALPWLVGLTGMIVLGGLAAVVIKHNDDDSDSIEDVLAQVEDMDAINSDEQSSLASKASDEPLSLGDNLSSIASTEMVSNVLNNSMMIFNDSLLSQTDGEVMSALDETQLLESNSRIDDIPLAFQVSPYDMAYNVDSSSQQDATVAIDTTADCIDVICIDAITITDLLEASDSNTDAIIINTVADYNPITLLQDRTTSNSSTDAANEYPNMQIITHLNIIDDNVIL